MSNSVSENLIFEITKELTSCNSHLNKDQIYNTLSKIIINYEITKIDNQPLECNLNSTIDMYLSAKKLDGLSNETLKSYSIHLKKFASEVHKNVEMISTADIRVFLGLFTHLKQSSLATKISVLKSFFVWLLQEEIIEKDPTKKLKTPKFNKHNPKYLNVDELEMLRESCQTLRQRALVELLYSTGCRLSEIQSVNTKQLDFHTFSLRVNGKGNKEREVFFSLKAKYHLDKYLDSRTDECEALFVTDRKPIRRLSKRMIQKEINEIAANSTIEKNVTVHSLRHTFSTLTLNNGAELSVVQSLLGHSSPSTTQIYAHLTDERKREQYKKHLVL